MLLHLDMQAAEESTDCWQAQAEEALLHVEQLKDMLADGTQWGDAAAQQDRVAGAADVVNAHGGRGPQDNVSASDKAAGVGLGSQMAVLNAVGEARQCSACAQNERTVAEQAVKIAELELEARAMQMEFSRCVQTSQQMGRAILPSLFSIESRLMDIQRV
jgi:hypothetical protein